MLAFCLMFFLPKKLIGFTFERFDIIIKPNNVTPCHSLSNYIRGVLELSFLCDNDHTVSTYLHGAATTDDTCHGALLM